MRLVVFGPHRDAQPFAPGVPDEVFDLRLPAVELALAAFGVEQKAVEITEPIEDQAVDLAGAADAAVMMAVAGPGMGLRLRWLANKPGRQWRDRCRIDAEG